jgi:phosphatidylserine decarboxylase
MNRLQTVFMAWIFPWFPKRLLSRGMGVIMRIPFPAFISYVALPLFAWIFGIRITDAEKSLGSYHSFDAFFTRKLKAGLRPIQGQVVHPVDGVLTTQGEIKNGELIQAKGWTYAAAEFLGDAQLAKHYEGGTFLTYYLCPADYHRVHAPTSGEMVSARHIPGLLWPVNEWSVHNIRRLFNLNERVVLNFESPRGKWSAVLVGATNVGHITITPDPSITTNRWLWHAPTDRQYSPPIPMAPGTELGMFHLGSTVICIFDKEFGIEVPGRELSVKMGEAW